MVFVGEEPPPTKKEGPTMNTPSFSRNTLGATLKRADQLNIGDRILVPRWDMDEADSIRIEVVSSVVLFGDDIEVNGGLTTSQGNTFVVIP
jgi:hypothetical protein